jgi:uncharacterized protein (DUF1800 family)
MTRQAISRRDLFRWGGGAAAGAAVVAAAPGATAQTRLRWTALAPADMPAPDAAAHLLSRAAFGARPGEVEHVRDIGAQAWLEEQLAWDKLDDSAVDNALKKLTTLAMTPRELFLVYDTSPAQAIDELVAATVYRQAFSRRQLYEVMVDFWSDHFSVYHLDSLVRVLKTPDDRDVIRRHALGKFKDLLTANASSPAMLNFLNNDENTRVKPNENYAREIMELHTLGVAVEDEPYSEQDVKEVARCLTGWRWNNDRNSADHGRFLYDARRHDDGAKRVLGQAIPAGGGMQDGQRVLDLLVNHPATPRFLATKLVRRFVTDDPAGFAPGLVERVAQSYQQKGGDIKAMLRVILLSDEFAGSFAAGGGRLSRPLDLVVRAFRAVDLPAAALTVDPTNQAWKRFTNAVWGRNGALNAMGQVPFRWLTPDGYPDRKQSWIGSSGDLARWNFGLALAQGDLLKDFKPATQRPAGLTTPGQVVDYWVERLTHRAVEAQDRATMIAFFAENGALPPTSQLAAREAQLIALILDSPYFQWR